MALIRVGAIEKRAVQHRQAKMQLATAQNNLDSAETRTDELEDRKQHFFVVVGLEDDDQQGLIMKSTRTLRLK
jgi:glycine cleavage system regulatory protein